MAVFSPTVGGPDSNSISYKLIILESLIFLIPFSVLSYIFYQIKLGLSHLLLFSLILLLVLAGLIMLRQFFDRICNVATFLKKAESGTIATLEIKKDVSELHDISISFNNLVTKLEQTSGELSQRALELLAIKELIDIARKSLDIDDLMNILLEKSMKVTGATIGSVFMVDPSFQRFRVVAAKGHKDELKINSYIDISDSLAKSAILEKKPVLIKDIESDPRTHKTNDPDYGPPSFITMPILVENRLAAVVNLAYKENGQLFDNNDEQVLSIMLGEISFALENAMLHKKVKEHLEEIKKHNIAQEQEIANRLQVERALRESDETYRAVFENTGTATAIVDESTTILLGNTGMTKLVGYSKDEVEGKKSWREFVVKDHLTKMQEYHQLRRLQPEKAPNEYEIQLINRQGDVKDVIMTIALIPGTKQTVVSFLDITERKKNEEKLTILNKEFEAVNRQLRLAYAEMRDSHDELKENIYKEDIGFLLNKEGFIEGVSERVLEHTGIPRTKVIGSTIADFLHKNYHDIFNDELQQAWLGVTREFNIEMISSKEEVCSYLLRLSRISLDNRKLILAILR